VTARRQPPTETRSFRPFPLPPARRFAGVFEGFPRHLRGVPANDSSHCIERSRIRRRTSSTTQDAGNPANRESLDVIAVSPGWHFLSTLRRFLASPPIHRHGSRIRFFGSRFDL